MSASARVLLFTGDGKGKTTAALGLALRACGHGKRVTVVQFIKSNSSTGELSAARNLPGLQIIQTGRGFVPAPSDSHFEKHKRAAQVGLARARELTTECDVLILDEICIAVAKGLLEESAVLSLMRSAPPTMIIVLTGRYATPALVEVADTVTEMSCVKHGYRTGRAAQEGVEF
ncbi:MAG TPA: cob(I)yrinic acid a,c-diamide adenosyltransferase [Planctomycetota bacterium]|jgi:cob(I)alamin adenosyltransferase